MSTPTPSPTPAPEVQVWLLLRDMNVATEVMGVYASPAALEFGILDMFRRGQDIGGLRAEPWVVTGGMPRPIPPAPQVPPVGNENRS